MCTRSDLLYNFGLCGEDWRALVKSNLCPQATNVVDLVFSTHMVSSSTAGLFQISWCDGIILA